MQSAIDQAVQVRLIATAPGSRPVPATLHYHPADPLAVRMSFPPEISLDGAAVEWTFARELLSQGLRGAAGTGDVRVRPLGDDRTVLELHVADGVAMVQMSSADIRLFLARAYEAVPAGEEQLDVDGGLAQLLGGES